jgi:PTS system cellobiose-specific IIA component
MGFARRKDSTMDDTKYQTAFQIILHAGNSKSYSMMAMQKAREGELGEASDLVNQADNALNEAHQIQTELAHSEITGTSIDMNIIMVHAQDHLGMAMMMRDVANEVIHIYRKFGQVL